jgi:hypothetical protein
MDKSFFSKCVQIEIPTHLKGVEFMSIESVSVSVPTGHTTKCQKVDNVVRVGTQVKTFFCVPSRKEPRSKLF